MSVKACKMLLLAGMIFVLVSFIFMQLWNYVIPQVFKLPELNFAQSSSILIMNRILFAGWGTPFRKNGKFFGQEFMEPEASSRRALQEPASTDPQAAVNDFRSRWEGLCHRSGGTAQETKKQEDQTSCDA